jgi:hypothetical protein
VRATDLRRASVALFLLPLLLLLGLTGCGADDGDGGDAASDEASASTSEASPSEGGSDDVDPDGPDDGDDGDDGDESDESADPDDGDDAPGGSRSIAPEDAPVCEPYLEMVTSLGQLDFSAKPDAVAAEMGPIMKEWAATVADAEQPPSMDDRAWDGLQTLTDRISDLPDEPTQADIEGVEDDLSDADEDNVDAAGQWFESTCA